MTMQQITIDDVNGAYDELIDALRETFEQNPLMRTVFGEDGPPYARWVDLITSYVEASPAVAQAIVDAISDDVLTPLRSNAGEAAYGESGGQTSQELSDPVENMVDTVPDWTDAAGLEFTNVYLRGQDGLGDTLQFQYEFGVALAGVMLAHESVLLYARAGTIDILLDTATALRQATAERERRRAAVGEALRGALVDVGISALTGNWAGAATNAIKGVANAALTDLTWPESDDPADICATMVDNFDILRNDLEERAALVSSAISALSDNLTGTDREHLLPPRTAEPHHLEHTPKPRQRIPVG